MLRDHPSELNPDPRFDPSQDRSPNPTPPQPRGIWPLLQPIISRITPYPLVLIFLISACSSGGGSNPTTIQALPPPAQAPTQIPNPAATTSPPGSTAPTPDPGSSTPAPTTGTPDPNSPTPDPNSPTPDPSPPTPTDPASPVPSPTSTDAGELPTPAPSSTSSPDPGSTPSPIPTSTATPPFDPNNTPDPTPNPGPQLTPSPTPLDPPLDSTRLIFPESVTLTGGFHQIEITPALPNPAPQLQLGNHTLTGLSVDGSTVFIISFGSFSGSNSLDISAGTELYLDVSLAIDHLVTVRDVYGNVQQILQPAGSDLSLQLTLPPDRISRFYDGDPTLVLPTDAGIVFGLAQGIQNPNDLFNYVNNTLQIPAAFAEAGIPLDFTIDSVIAVNQNPQILSDFDGDGDRADVEDALVLFAISQRLNTIPLIEAFCSQIAMIPCPIVDASALPGPGSTPFPLFPGVIEFGSALYTSNEGSEVPSPGPVAPFEPIAVVQVERRDGFDGLVSVQIDLDTSDPGTATGGNPAAITTDYDNTIFPITVQFVDDDFASQTISIPVQADELPELDETINLVIVPGSATGGATIGPVMSTTLTLLNDDGGFVVNSVLDEVDLTIGDGVCLTASSVCTLRAAIQEANAQPGRQTISFDPGTTNGIPIQLSLAGAGEDQSATGDLDIREDLTILGNGSADTIIDADGIDRIFDLNPGGVVTTVSMSGMTLGSGAAANSTGGAILNRAGSDLTADDLIITNNSSASGGGVRNDGSFSLSNSSVISNFVTPLNGFDGGGIDNTGDLILNTVVIDNNTAPQFGGGIATTGPLIMTDSTLSNNNAVDGGGLYSEQTGSPITVDLTNTDVVSNTASAGDGGGIKAIANVTLTLSGGSFQSNTASDDGGALFIGPPATLSPAGIPTTGDGLFSGIQFTGNTPNNLNSPGSVRPTITLPGSPLNYTQGSPPTVIDPAATVTDADSLDFNGGSLTVQINPAVDSAEDTLSIEDQQGAGVGPIGFDGSLVTFGGNLIGTASGGSGGIPLTISFTTADATVAEVEALVQAITFESNSGSFGDRFVDFQVDDGDGGTVTETQTVTLSSGLIITNTDDLGPGSLRDAIDLANLSPGEDTVTFAIPGVGPHVITLSTPLPPIDDVIVLDATSQTGTDCAVGTLQVVIEGGSLGFGDGFLLQGGDNSIISGFVIRNFPGNGIAIETAGNTITCNFIGLDDNGSTAAGNGIGILIDGQQANTIGGINPEDRNVISGNLNQGIEISGAGSGNNTIQGNFIGTDLTGLLAVPNGGDGILISSEDGNTIGATNSGTACDTGCNLISGNVGAGIRIDQTTTDPVIILGNYIGTNLAGDPTLGNDIGIAIIDAGGNAIGADTPGQGNRIQGNTREGIGISGNMAIGNQILGNSIFENGMLGIDLGFDGVTLNDPTDSDSGPNGLQNFPDLSLADPDTDRITGSLTSAPDTDFRIQFFANPFCDPTDHGEGQDYLGAIDVTTDASGIVLFDSDVAPGTGIADFVDGDEITATATRLGIPFNTSEFSICLTATPEEDLIVNTIADGPDDNIGDGVCQTVAGECSLRAAIQEANLSSGEIITFDPLLNGSPIDLSLGSAGEDNADGGDLDIKADMQIIGNGPENTIINGSGINDRVFHVDPESFVISVEISELTITGGDTTVEGTEGGGILNQEGSSELTLTNVEVDGNVAASGGGISNLGMLTINSSLITNNTAVVSAGGGIDNSGTLMANDSVISDNVADNPGDTGAGGGIFSIGVVELNNASVLANFSDEGGGGIFNDGLAILTLTNGSIVQANEANRSGAGIYNQSGSVTVEGGSLVSGNIADADGDNDGDGGGIYNQVEFSGETASLVIDGLSTIISGNTAVNGGGIFNDFDATFVAGDAMVTITNEAELSGNSASGNGGGTFNNDGLLTINGLAQVSTNDAFNGGGIFNTGTGLIQGEAEIFANTVTNNGGGIHNSGGSITIQDLAQVSFNDTLLAAPLVGNGGGIFNVAGGEVTISNAIIASNTASEDGGGLLNADSSDVTIAAGSQISQNAAQNDGGGIKNFEATLTIQDSGTLITDNEAVTASGGGIANEDADLIVQNGAAITNNLALNEHGGGIFHTGTGTLGSLHLEDATIADNVANAGGGVWIEGVNTTIDHSTIARNDTDALDGGGLYVVSDVSLLNSTIAENNSAGRGGGIFVLGPGSTVSLSFTTIGFNNSSTLNGGGGVYNDDGGLVVARGTVFAQNTGPVVLRSRDFVGTFTTSEYNLVGDILGLSVTPILGDLFGGNADLQFLTDNGGLTETLELGSPSEAIDQVPSGECTDLLGALVATDQRGVERPQRTSCDIGSFERE